MANTIAGFDVFELVGRGGMGSVYRALDPLIGRTVAIKVIRLVGYNNQDEAAYLKERLFKEARAAGSLSHPSIATVYQAGCEADIAFIAMEYIDGPTLEAKLALGQRAQHTDLLRTLRDTAAALDYAHQRGIIHRDIKPSNIMSTAAGLTKVTDFGIAKTMLGHTHTQEGQLLGTPFYMSPEQIQGKRLDGRSDQFALAVVAYEAFTGNRPFLADSITNLCYQIVHAEPICPNDLDCNLPPDALLAFKRALKKDPSKRFATCTEFISQLDAALSGSTPIPIIESVPAAPPARPRRSYLNAAIFAVLLFMTCAAAGWYLQQPRVAGPPASAAAPTIPQAAPTIPQAALAPLPVDNGNPRKFRPHTPALLPQAESSRDPVLPKPASTGYLLWSGPITTSRLVTMNSGSPSTGYTSGSLPEPPYKLEVFPVLNANGVLTAYTTDPDYAEPVVLSFAGAPVRLTWDPRHVNDLSVWQTPSPENSWKTLTLRINVSTVDACLIKWIKPPA